MKRKLAVTALSTLLLCGLVLAPSAVVAEEGPSTDAGTSDGTGGGSGQTEGSDGTGGGSGGQQQ